MMHLGYPHMINQCSIPTWFTRLIFTLFMVLPGSQIAGEVKIDQTIVFSDPGEQTYGVSPLTLSATASSELIVVFTVASGPATISGTTLTITGAGSVVVHANQSGNANYNPATQVSRTITVNKANQTITFPDPGTPTFGDGPLTLTASSSSGLPIVYTVASGPATISGNTLTITGAGSVVVQVNQSGNANYNPATQVSRTITVNKADQTITFPDPGAQTYGVTPLSLTATSSSLLAVIYTVASGPATINGNTLTITGAGSVVIDANQSGNSDYNPATQVSRTITVNKANQTITFPDPGTPTFGDTPLTLTASSSSGLAIVYTIASGPATVSGNTLTLTGAGSVVVQANQSGNANYNPATQVSRTITVKANQTIIFPDPGTPTFGDAPLTLTASSSSGLAIVYTVASGPATISGNTLTITGAGSVVVHANQSGNANYNAATQVSRTITVNKANQTITFPDPGTPTFGDAPLTLAASSSSGLAIVYTIASGPATVSGNTLTITGAGSVVVQANQSGNSDYNPAIQASRTITVNKASQTITFPDPGTPSFGDEPLTLTASSSSGLAIAYTVASGPATISGNALTITGTGNVVVQANQSGNSNYNPATQASRTITVNKTNQTITFPDPGVQTYGVAPLSLTASSSSGLAIVYTVASGPATISGNSLTITGAGSVVVQANQSGNLDFNPATQVSRTITVNKADQTITFPDPGGQTYGVAPLSMAASTSSGLAIVYTVASGPATISGNTLTITGAGSVVVQANQSGNANYNPATQVSRTITVNKANQTITFPDPGTQTYGVTPLSLAASCSSNLAIIYTVASGPATISGNTLTITGAGSVVVQANQSGNENYNSAAQVSQTITVNKSIQTITFPDPGTQTYGVAPLSLTASCSSNLAIVYTVASGPATISGNTLTITGQWRSLSQRSPIGMFARSRFAASRTPFFCISC